MAKTDFKKTMKALYDAPRGRFETVGVPPMRFLMVDGEGDPNTAAAYRSAVEALYATSYAIKFATKAATGQDYVVPPLEGLWHVDDPAAFVQRRKHEWRWTMMIMVPDMAGEAAIDAALERTRMKLGALPASMRIATFDEGRCLQALHVGSYDDEGPLLAQLHDAVMPAAGLTFNGPHHEIYLSDPRRVAAAKLRTILRQPVKPL